MTHETLKQLNLQWYIIMLNKKKHVLRKTQTTESSGYCKNNIFQQIQGVELP